MQTQNLSNPRLAKVAATLKLLPFPTRFAIEISAECNLSCAMCHHPFMRRAKGRMPFELWKKCADQVARISRETQCWFSFIGEPLLEPELLLQMLDYGKKVGLRSLNINSNGMLLDPSLAEKVLLSGVDSIVFGVDGFSADTYEKLRILGKREVVYANIRYLLKLTRARGSGPDILVQFIEMPENQHELEEFRAYWLAQGAQLKIRKMMSWGGTFGTPLNVPQEERIPCPWGLTMMHVFWDGRVPRCSGDVEGEEAVGNAWEQPLSTLWGRLADFHKLHLEHRFSELPENCQRCKDWMTGAADKISPDLSTSHAPGGPG